MGRAARLARALAEDNRGNRGRIVMAHGTCNQLLCADLRIQEQYRDWVVAGELHRRQGPPPWARTPADVDRCLAAVREAEIDYIAGVLRAMGVPWRWCAEALVTVYFPTMRHNAQHPGDQRGVRVSADIRGRPRGQAPPHDGQNIARNVRWWYRHRIKDPIDSVVALAEEYAIREKRVTDCRSVVQDGITEAETLLNAVVRP